MCLWTILWPWIWGLGSLKVIKSGTIRYSTYEFIFVFYSKYASIYYRFWDISASGRKLLPPCIRRPRWGWSCQIYGTTLGGEKLEWWWAYQIVKEFRWHVQNAWTDGQTELPWHIRAIAYMLSHIKTSNVLVTLVATEQNCSQKPFKTIKAAMWNGIDRQIIILYAFWVVMQNKLGITVHRIGLHQS